MRGETRPLAAGDLAAVAPGDWERERLVPVAALRLVELDYDASAWLDGAEAAFRLFRDWAAPTAPATRPTSITASSATLANSDSGVGPVADDIEHVHVHGLRSAAT